MRQLVLDLPVEPRFGRDDFLVSPSNEEAYSLLERWPDWPNPFLHLRGPAGSGKSHLAAIWALRAEAPVLPAASVTDEISAALADVPALVLENVDQGPFAEGALFHLVNIARERQISVLLTSAAPFECCGIATPDLLSRLRLAPSTEIHPPDDALLKAVLVKLFVDRQLVVDTSVVDYIATRIERSLARAAEVVAALDREGLSRGRRITRPVAAALLAEQDDGPNMTEP
jgi:chromosomal replication initiation ATPase DnaA